MRRLGCLEKGLSTSNTHSAVSRAPINDAVTDGNKIYRTHSTCILPGTWALRVIQ